MNKPAYELNDWLHLTPATLSYEEIKAERDALKQSLAEMQELLHNLELKLGRQAKLLENLKTLLT